MSRDPLTSGEILQAKGPLTRLLALPIVFVVAGAVVVAVLRGSEVVGEHAPDLPLVVDALLLVALGGLLFYGAFRVSDAIRR